MIRCLRARRPVLPLAAAVVSIMLAGCGSSSHSSAGGGHTYTIGLLVDATGAVSSSEVRAIKGVEAGINLARRQGYTINLVQADTTSTPAGALSAAQRLVEQHHVLAVITESALTFAAAGFLTQQGVPVIGPSLDGEEWLTAKNMFAEHSPDEPTRVPSTVGKFLKLAGATSLGSLGYSGAPNSAAAAEAYATSARHAGLKVGYLNASVPLGSTNVAPLALGMKSARVDGLAAALSPNTILALATALRQDGVHLKAALMFTYGADLTQGGPATMQAAQGAYTVSAYEPMEMHTAATERFANALKTVGVGGDPSPSEYNGYVDVALLVRGLQGAGPSPTHASLINSLASIHDFDGAGLWGSITINLASPAPTAFGGPGNCGWVTKVVGSGFQLVPGADPICGPFLPGK